MAQAFTLRDWSAFAPGLADKQAWIAWAVDPFLPQGDAVPALSAMPPMQRRRVDKLGRMALQVAWNCQPETAGELPLVFASRHGDLERTYAMLRELAQDQPLSPTHFGLSTHNAIAAQYSIARDLTGNGICIAAGTATAESAIVEALGLLADGAGEVLVVVYDSPLPEGYASFRDEPEASYAWSARLAFPRKGEAIHRLLVEQDTVVVDALDAPPLPHGLEVLRYLIGALPALEHRENGRRWRWQRDG